MTTGIVLLLCAIQAITGLEEDIAKARATWGLNPENPLSWFTHAFVHNDGGHLALNIMVFWTSGGLVELYLGRSKLAVIMFIGIAAAVMSVIAVPEYWVTNSNPIGFSAVAQATFVLGVYLGGRVITVWLAKTLRATPVLKKLRDGLWSVLGTIVGITAVALWLIWAIGGEWQEPDAAPRIAHSFGMLAGAIITLIVATSTDKERDRRLGRPLIGFAITVALIAILAFAFPPE